MVLPLLAALLTAAPLVAATQPEYDYVIVGSGPGGGSLAANLAAAGNSVFLLEAGGDSSESIIERIPGLNARGAENPPHSWQFFVEHYQNETQARRDSKYAYRLDNGSYYVGLEPPAGTEPAGVLYPRGATLGGSSQVNAMNFAWAPDNEWDYIANLTGDDSWGHEHMRRHLMELENCTYVPVGTPGKGSDGYLVNSHMNPMNSLLSPNVANYTAEIFRLTEGIEVEGVAQMAELLDRDVNMLDNDRYEDPLMFVLPLAIDPSTGSRSSIARYINSIINADYPLTLSLHSLVSKILFEECNGRPKAVGVEYLVGEGLYSADRRYNASYTPETRSVYAKKEVIIAGGTFNTPQILKLSGIGPREELESFGIPVVADLPAVGNFMQDNYESPVLIEAEVPWTITPESNCTMQFNASDPCFVLWESTGQGPYSLSGGSFFLTWRSSVSWDNDSDLFFLSIGGFGDYGFFPGFSNRGPRPNEWITTIVRMQTANPAGTVTLRSADPRVAPEINFNYFANRAEEDLQAIAEGTDLLLQAFENVGIPYTVLQPNPRIERNQAVLDETFSHHATSSCRMGPVGDRNACVDSKFRVNGVDNLRIVDASVFPRVPGAMPNGPTFTLSRKAFEVIHLGL